MELASLSAGPTNATSTSMERPVTDRGPSAKRGQNDVRFVWEGNTLFAVGTGVRIAVAELDAKNGLALRWMVPGKDAPPLQDPRAPTNREVAEVRVRTHDTGLVPDSMLGERSDARAIMRTLVADGIRDSTRHQDIVAAVASTLSIPVLVAQLVVMTEIRGALGYANVRSGRLVGFKGKSWSTSCDPGICPDCAGNSAQGVIPIDQPFQSGHQHAPAHLGCRCGVSTHRECQSNGL